jgi:hypothetical protein
LQKQLLSAGQFCLHNICKYKKCGEICCEHNQTVKFAGFLGIQWEKAPFDPKNPPPKLHFPKYLIFLYFLCPEAVSNSSKVQVSQKRKNVTEKCQNKDLFEIFSLKKLLGGVTFWNFQYFVLVLE